MRASLFPASGTFIFKFTFYSVYLFLPALGLYCFVKAFSSCGAWVPHCGGFSCCGAQALGTWVSVAAACGLQSAGSAVAAHGLSFPSTWDLPGPGTEPVSPALAGRFLSTAPPGKS